MALLLIEGFDQYTIADEQEMARSGWSGNTGLGVSTIRIQAGTRHGGVGHQLQIAQSGVEISRAIPEVTEFTCGVAFRYDFLANHQLIGWEDDATNQINILLTLAGEIQIRRNTVELDITSGQNLLSDTWYYLEVKIKIDNSTGTYEVHLDGSQILVGTNDDTQNTVNNVVNRLILFGSSSMDPIFDDLYFLDVSGSDNVTFLGDCRIETVFPDSDGNETDFTPLSGNNWQNVDDGLSPDDDSTYNHSNTATDRDLYGFAALSGNVGTIFGVDAKMLVRKEEAGFREVRVIARNGTTEIESASLTLGVSWEYKNLLLENNPDGGGDWDEASVNAAQFGIDLHT